MLDDALTVLVAFAARAAHTTFAAHASSISLTTLITSHPQHI